MRTIDLVGSLLGLNAQEGPQLSHDSTASVHLLLFTLLFSIDPCSCTENRPASWLQHPCHLQFPSSNQVVLCTQVDVRLRVLRRSSLWVHVALELIHREGGDVGEVHYQMFS